MLKKKLEEKGITVSHAGRVIFSNKTSQRQLMQKMINGSHKKFAKRFYELSKLLDCSVSEIIEMLR